MYNADLNLILARLRIEDAIKELHSKNDIGNIRSCSEERDGYNLEDNLENKVKHYESRIRDYAKPEKYQPLDFYLRPGIKLEFRWHRFPNLNPTGVAYRTLFKIELDQDLRSKPDFANFVGHHETGHIDDEKGYDEDLNTIKRALHYQLITGNNYTHLPK